MIVRNISSLFAVSMWLGTSSLAAAPTVPAEPTAGPPVKSDPVPSCSGVPEVISDLGTLTEVERLPKSVLVASRMDLWVESADNGAKMWVAHNFRTGQKEFRCANLSEDLTEHFSIPGIALWDRTEVQRTGDSVWQFQILVQGAKLGLWNQKSGFFKVRDLLEGGKLKAHPQFFTTEIGEVQARWRQDIGKYHVEMVIRYDTVGGK